MMNETMMNTRREISEMELETVVGGGFLEDAWEWYVEKMKKNCRGFRWIFNALKKFF